MTHGTLHRLRASIIVSILAVSTSGSESLHARPLPGSCGQCYSSDFADAHRFYGSSCGSIDCMDCAAFNACHVNNQQGRCSSWHYACTQPVDTEVGGEAFITRQLAPLADRGDAEGLERLMRDHPRALHFNAARRAMQVTGCGGEVIAVFPVDVRAGSRLASRLGPPITNLEIAVE